MYEDDNRKLDQERGAHKVCDTELCVNRQRHVTF